MQKSEGAAHGLEMFGAFLLFVSFWFGGVFLYAMDRDAEGIGKYPNVHPHFAEDTIFLLIGVCVLITGLGLLGRRRWAAIIFSVPGLFLGARIAIGCISNSSIGIDMGYNIPLRMGLAGIMALPSILTASCWRLLPWRRSERKMGITSTYETKGSKKTA